MFKVVADQLKISEGWVRCGHCADVFDATLYLQPWTPPQGEEEAPSDFLPEAPEPGPQMAPPPDEQQTVFDSLPREEEGAWQGSNESPDDERNLETLPPPEDLTAAQLDEVESDFHGELERFAASLGRLNAAQVTTAVNNESSSTSDNDEARANAGAEDLSDAGTLLAIPRAPAPRELTPEEVNAQAVMETAAAVQHDEPVLEPGFVRQARRQAFWRKPGVRIALSLVALLLAALLAGQWAVQERDRLAAWQPGLQPSLQQACAHLGCTLSPVRRIDALVIDSTALVNRLGDFYSFDLVLKNTASIALAVPALELSLTDLGGSVISRRVFLPTEWPDAPAVLPALGSITVSFRLALTTGEATPMAGYNALIFYP